MPIHSTSHYVFSKFLISICLLLFVSNFIYAQPKSPFIQNFTNTVYGKKSNPEIYAVVQDNENRIIAGTSKGLKIYNGVSWDFVGVRDGSYVTALSKTQSGKIMVGAVGDFGILKTKSDGSYYFVSLTVKLNLNEPVWRVHCIGETSYFQTESCIYVVKAEKIVAKIKPQTSFHLSFLVGDRILVRQREKGIYELKNNSLQLIDSSQKILNDGVFAIFEKGGALYYFTRNESSDLAYERSIYGGIKLSDGNYLINTLNDGVYILNKNFQVINHIDKYKGITDNDVKNCYQGSDGNLWLATNNGLSFVEYESDISYYNHVHGIEGDVQDIWFSANTLFAATSKGIFRETATRFEATPINFPVWQFVETEKGLFSATAEGIYQVRETNQFKCLLKGNFNNIEWINNQFIISGPAGVLITDAQFNVKKKIDLPLSQTLKIYHDKKHNDIWIGTAISGVIRITSELNIDIYNEEDGLNKAWVKPMANHNGELVFASTEGLQRFIYEDEMRKFLPDSLKDKPEFARGTFEPIHKNNEEISEIFMFKGLQMYVVANEVKEFKNSNFVKSAYNHLDFGRINRVKNFYGNSYICTSEGLIVLEQNAPILRNNFLLSMAEVSAGNKNISFDSAATIDFKDNNLYFVFQAPIYIHGIRIKYRYKLVGLDEQWSEAISDNHVALNNLFEGNYTIKIQAENSLGEISNSVSFSFHISPPWYRTIFAYIIYLLLLSALFWLSIYMGRRRLQKKNEELEQIVKERTSEIAHQKELIEEKHLEITDSINYAQRIQSAMMMNDEYWKDISEDHFVLFKPRDVVSGDFYWAYQNKDVAVWAAADCTGHGVPGALMSMLGMGFLNEIVIEGKNHQPAEILNLLRTKIIKALEQKGSSTESKDGMDICLCSLDKKNHKLFVSGANNPLVFITQNSEKANAMNDPKMLTLNGFYLLTISGDKMPVGKFILNNSFSQNEIDVEKGDLCYSLSDGYPDQFGGPDGKKFMIKRFKQLLIENAQLSMTEQSQLLDSTFINWIKDGSAEQIDDVCVVGVKF